MLLPTRQQKECWVTTHCLDLVLEEMGKDEKIKSAIQKARKLTVFIYSHTCIEHDEV